MANTKISQLASAGSLTGSEVLPVVQSGTTKKVTAQAIADLAAAGGGASNMVITTDGSGSATNSHTNLEYNTIYPISTSNGDQSVTPVNYVGGGLFGGTTTTLTISGVQAIALNIGSFDNLTSIAFPDVTTIANTGMTSLSISNIPTLTNISLPALNNILVGGYIYISFTSNALSQASVDHILAKFAYASPVAGNATLSLTGGTNAAPSAAGLASKAILVGKGWTVNHN